jgi:molecular chaperone GrpE
VAKKKEAKRAAPVGEEVIEVTEETEATEVQIDPQEENLPASLEEQLQAAQAEVAGNKDLYLRALADLENYRKRAQREKEDAFRFANDRILREIIPVLDNLERAVEHAHSSAGEQNVLLEGVEMTLEQFRKVLESSGVTAVEAMGQPFNPDFHQAIGQVPTADQPVNSVVQVLQKGYLLNDRLLRPAMVMVATALPEEEIKTEGQTDEQTGAVE